jgi:hypothetical protein
MFTSTLKFLCFVTQAALVAFDAAIKEKVALVCTMELASQRAAGERSLSFADIASATRLPVEQVEWLLMRAMSLGLIRGSIDEVDQVVHVSYIKVCADAVACRYNVHSWPVFIPVCARSRVCSALLRSPA